MEWQIAKRETQPREEKVFTKEVSEIRMVILRMTKINIGKSANDQ